MVFNKKTVVLNFLSHNKNDTLKKVSDYLVKINVGQSTEKIYQEFINREQEFSTGIQNGIAIPHIQSNYINKVTVLYIRLKNPIEWKTLDNSLVKQLFVIVVPNTKSNLHLDILATISKLLLNDTFLKTLDQKSSQSDVITTINKFLSQEENEVKTDVKTTEKKVKRLNVVGVTSCPTGIAHTNLAAEALEKYAKENNIDLRVERQAAQGVVNKLTPQQIENADFVIIATGRPIDGKARFNGKKTLQVKVQAPLQDVKKVFDDLLNASVLKIKSSQTTNILAQEEDVEKVSPMKAIMNGLSYMIPFVVVGGILLAISIGFGGDKGEPPTSGSWYAIFQIGLAGMSLMVIILGGFIAHAIAGRAALAPAMILSFICNGAVVSGTINPFFFNYELLQFGVETSNLGFFGSIAVGFLVGYAVKNWRTFVSPHIPKSLQTVEPILFTPLFFTLVGWTFFAFAGYLPLYYLSIGLKNGVNELINLDLLWIVGLVLGGMMSFDMGGPVNKVAFGLGVALIATQPQIMGMVSAAGGVAPIGSGIGYYVGRHFFKVKSFENEIDKSIALPALIMGTLGITEGAIPFAVRHPKSAIIANVIGGMLAGALAGVFLISSSAPHTSIIIYFLGAIGKNGVTMWAYGLLYILAIILGALLTATIFITLEKLYEKRTINFSFKNIFRRQKVNQPVIKEINPKK